MIFQSLILNLPYMDGYLKGYYGYKNFGDELLFFGVVNQIRQLYDIDRLFIETQDKSRFDRWLLQNKDYLEMDIDKLVTIKTQKVNYFISNILGLGKHKKAFKFFGGGEVLNDERGFPHDGRNIPLLFGPSVRKKQFTLLGGIGKMKRKRTKKLYHYLLPKADKIICREKDSYEVVKKLIGGEVKKLSLYQDFSKEILEKYMSKKEKKNISMSSGAGGTPQYCGGTGVERYNLKEEAIPFDSIPFHSGGQKGKYILININSYIFNDDSIKKIKIFCKKYPDHKKIFFPCDMQDDVKFYDELKKEVPALELYDRTQYSLDETLSLFYDTDAGIGARLHFLYPLKVFNKILEPIVYKDKVRKLILCNDELEMIDEKLR